MFRGAVGVGKDAVSRAWRKVKVDWEALGCRSLAEEDIARLILDGTVGRFGADECRRYSAHCGLCTVSLKRV